ncbi:MAG: hypothetical protein Fur003_0150 [Candidatus Dojkabacteria bacterium]
MYESQNAVALFSRAESAFNKALAERKEHGDLGLNYELIEEALMGKEPFKIALAFQHLQIREFAAVVWGEDNPIEYYYHLVEVSENPRQFSLAAYAISTNIAKVTNLGKYPYSRLIDTSETQGILADLELIHEILEKASLR